jgi:hypothetical protein
MIATLAILDQLLNLKQISTSDSNAVLGWQHPMPIWAWVLIVAAAFLFAGWSYRHLLGRQAVRTTLTLVRAMVIVWVIILLAGPMLVVEDYEVLPDWLIVLVDRSASMGVADAPEVSGEPAVISRDQQLRETLAAQALEFEQQDARQEREVVWFGFDRGIYRVTPDDLPDAAGQGTALRTALDQVLRRAAGHPISAVLLLTDGRSSQQTGDDLVARLTRRSAPVYAVPLGAQEMMPDLSIEQVQAPDKAFVNDAIPVTVYLQAQPSVDAIDPARVTVRLLDPATGDLLDEQKPDSTDLSKPVRLTAKSAMVGQIKWRVEAVYDGRETAVTNNHRKIIIELIDRPLRVLYIEGYPRWEYRYLKNMLLREKSIESSVLLLSADRRFAQEGEIALTRMATTRKEMEPYDVIIIGDVPGSYFTSAQLSLISDQVAGHGAGLIWISGPRHTPRSYDASELAPLLPMRKPATVDVWSAALGGLKVIPSPLAHSLGVLQLRSEKDDRQTDWPANLPPLRWVQSLGDLKPAVEVLAHAAVTNGVGDPVARSPLITRMRYGAGQVIYVGTDETWRWRFGRGDYYFEQVWTQLIRMLGRNRVQQDTQRVRLTVSHRRVVIEQVVVVQLWIDDPLLVQRKLERISVAVYPADDDQAAPVGHIDLSRTKDAASGRLLYEALWRPTKAGRMQLRVTEPGLSDLGAQQVIEVSAPDDEMRYPAPDRPRLELLARQTGGALVEPGDLADLFNKLPMRAKRTADDRSEPLWDSYLALLTMVVLLTGEWVGRKLIRLV